MGKTKSGNDNSKSIFIVVGIIVVILIGVLLLTNNKDDKKEQGEQGGQAQGEVKQETKIKMNEDFSSAFLTMDNVAIADTRQDIIEALGEPEREEDVNSKIPSVKETRLIYDGGDTSILVRNERVELIESSNKDKTFVNGLKIGSSKNDVEKSLPESSKVKKEYAPEDSIIYSEVNSEGYKFAKYIRFEIKNGKINKVILSIGD